MSDEDLRDLERKWKESGDEQDAGQYLAARLRSGETVTRRLVEQSVLMGRLLSMLGDGSPQPDLRRLAEQILTAPVTAIEILAWLAWPVIKHGQVTRFVCAPNHPTAIAMCKDRERIGGAGRQLRKVPYWYRQNALQTWSGR